MSRITLFIKSLLTLLMLLLASSSFGVTSLDNAQEGYGVVQVKGAMWGSGLLMLMKNEEASDESLSGFTLSVLTPSHLIQNAKNPTIQIPRRYGTFLTGSIRDKESIIPSVIALESQDIPATVLFQDALRDIAILKINLTLDDPKFVTLFDIAQHNLVLCQNENSDSLCFQGMELRSSMFYNEKINWILNGKLVRQPLNKENAGRTVSLVKDQYISGLFKNIFEISAYGGPGMSGGGFYLNDKLVGMVSKVHYDGYPEVYAVPMNEIYTTLSCFYWQTKDCTDEKLTSSWMSSGNLQYLNVNYKGSQLRQLVAPTPFGFAGGPGVIGSGGGPGVIGSGGSWTTDPYVYIHNLPGAELMETTGIPLVNPFSLSENTFLLNNQKYCGLKTTENKSEISASIPRVILMNKDNVEVALIPCSKQQKLNSEQKFQAPQKARYFAINRKLSTNNKLHYDFTDSSFNSFTQLQKLSTNNSLDNFTPPKPAFLDTISFSFNSKGCMNTFPISLCNYAKPSEDSLFTAQINYLTDGDLSSDQEVITISLNKNFDSISLTKKRANNEPEKSTVLKKQKATQNSILYANETNTTRAILNFSDEDKLQPFNLFIQTPKLFIQFEW
ncbi:MAG: hypothetical protein ACXVCY_14545 [Pseudobdellovibrionaceae bacterium]